MKPITVNEMIKRLEYLKRHGFGDCPVIYASDDEGNAFDYVYNEAGSITDFDDIADVFRGSKFDQAIIIN